MPTECFVREYRGMGSLSVWPAGAEQGMKEWET